MARFDKAAIILIFIILGSSK